LLIWKLLDTNVSNAGRIVGAKHGCETYYFAAWRQAGARELDGRKKIVKRMRNSQLKLSTHSTKLIPGGR
jgi:hypothetical protein